MKVGCRVDALGLRAVGMTDGGQTGELVQRLGLDGKVGRQQHLSWRERCVAAHPDAIDGLFVGDIEPLARQRAEEPLQARLHNQPWK